MIEQIQNGGLASRLKQTIQSAEDLASARWELLKAQTGGLKDLGIQTLAWGVALHIGLVAFLVVGCLAVVAALQNLWGNGPLAWGLALLIPVGVAAACVLKLVSLFKKAEDYLYLDGKKDGLK